MGSVKVPPVRKKKKKKKGRNGGREERDREGNKGWRWKSKIRKEERKIAVMRQKLKTDYIEFGIRETQVNSDNSKLYRF
jgi:hypothetical protein